MLCYVKTGVVLGHIINSMYDEVKKIRRTWQFCSHHHAFGQA